MPPNAIETPFESAPETSGYNGNKNDTPTISSETKGNSLFDICQHFLNLLAHLLTGILTGIIIIFVFRNELPLGPPRFTSFYAFLGMPNFNLFILADVGTDYSILATVHRYCYQLLMAEAVLSLVPIGWAAKLRLVDRRRVHWILQILGSVLAIAGSIIKILDKNEHWNTLHGQFALVAMVFTVVCLVNGLTSLYAYELRKILPGNLSKITHILFGVVAFASASISLCYGMDKVSFRNWATPEVTYAVMAITALQIVVIIINPLITCTYKTVNVFKK